jgi:prepilin-type N-terminal cleavage/methylation domain-containing protein
MNKHGFTLLETLIYIALFGVLMTGALVTVYELLLSFEHNGVAIAVQEEGTFIHRKLNWALSGSTGVTVPNTHTISINRPDLGTESPLVFSFSDEKVYLTRGSGVETILSGLEFNITDVAITTVPPSGTISTKVRVLYNINSIPFMYETYLHF